MHIYPLILLRSSTVISLFNRLQLTGRNLSLADTRSSCYLSRNLQLQMTLKVHQSLTPPVASASVDAASLLIELAGEDSRMSWASSILPRKARHSFLILQPHLALNTPFSVSFSSTLIWRQRTSMRRDMAATSTFIC